MDTSRLQCGQETLLHGADSFLGSQILEPEAEIRLLPLVLGHDLGSPGPSVPILSLSSLLHPGDRSIPALQARPRPLGVLLFSLFSRQAGGRLGEEGRGDEGLGVAAPGRRVLGLDLPKDGIRGL